MPTNPIVPLPAVKSYLRIAEDDFTQDEFLQFWIDAVSDAVERHLRGPVAVQAVSDEIRNGDGTSRIMVERQPIVSLQNNSAEDVMVRTSPGADWEVLESDTAFLRIDAAEPWHIHLDRSVFPSGVANIKVCYRAGYEEIPGQITRVVVESVAELLKESNQGSGRLGQRSRSVGGINSSGATDSFYDLDDRHREMLAPFVRIVV